MDRLEHIEVLLRDILEDFASIDATEDPRIGYACSRAEMALEQVKLLKESGH